MVWAVAGALLFRIAFLLAMPRVVDSADGIRYIRSQIWYDARPIFEAKRQQMIKKEQAEIKKKLEMLKKAKQRMNSKGKGKGKGKGKKRRRR